MKILQNYKNKQCKTWIGNYLQRLTFTWIYKIYTSIALVLIAAIAFSFTKEGTFMDNFVSGLYSLGLFGFILLAAVMFGYMFYAGWKGLINWIKKRK